MTTDLMILTDVHLCHIDWSGMTSADRLRGMAERLRGEYAAKPYAAQLFLGDYSLDFWQWDVGGSWVREGISNTARFVKTILPALPAPSCMIPGNHEQYGPALWRAITGGNRQFCLTVGGWLIICLDTFAGDLDPEKHSDGTYTGADVGFIADALASHPGTPVLLCAHFFPMPAESEAFLRLLSTEKRIRGLFCGHDHLGFRETLPCGIPFFHCGHYSYPGGGNTLAQLPWGYLRLTLAEDGFRAVYIFPENEAEGETIARAERDEGFFPLVPEAEKKG